MDSQISERLRAWMNREFGEVNFYLTQFLTGHGCFRAYLYKMGKVASPVCQYDDSNNDDAGHTFECAKWTEKRLRLSQNVGHITPDNVVDIMLTGEGHWRAVAAFVEDVLRQKKSEAT